MNFYKHHIGDYAQATAHLSFVEDAAYSRLLRKVYADERALPADRKAVQRLVGARTKEEREAVDLVLDEFFELREDGWHNKRADAELAKANAQAEANRKVAADREARKRARQAEEERAAGVHGSSGEQHESLRPAEHESLPSREPSQTPDARHQTPDLNTGGERALSTAASARVTTAGAVCIALKAEGIAPVNPGHPKLLALLDRGAEIANFVSAARTAVDRGKGFAYVLGTVEGQLDDAAQLARSARAAPTRPASRADQRTATIAALTGQNRTERTDHAAGQPGAVDVEARVVPE